MFQLLVQSECRGRERLTLTQLSQLKILFIDFFGHLHDFGFFFRGMLGKEGSNVSVGISGGGLLAWILVLVSFVGTVLGSMSLFFAFEARPTFHKLSSFVGGDRVDVHGIWVSSWGSGKRLKVHLVETADISLSPSHCFEDFTFPPSIVVSDREVRPFFERFGFTNVE